MSFSVNLLLKSPCFLSFTPSFYPSPTSLPVTSRAIIYLFVVGHCFEPAKECHS